MKSSNSFNYERPVKLTYTVSGQMQGSWMFYPSSKRGIWEIDW